MSNKTQLQTNNTNLASYTDRVSALIDVANSLPEAGGSGGGSVDTCTVNIVTTRGGNDTARIVGYMCTSVDNGQIKIDYMRPSYNSGDNIQAIQSEVVCGSSMILWLSGILDFWEFTTDNITIVEGNSDIESIIPFLVLTVSTEANSTSSLVCEYTD